MGSLRSLYSQSKIEEIQKPAEELVDPSMLVCPKCQWKGYIQQCEAGHDYLGYGDFTEYPLCPKCGRGFEEDEY